MSAPKVMHAPNLKTRYTKEIIPALSKKFNIKNTHAVPRLEKIVVNMGVGEGAEDIKKLEDAARELAQITGQKPLITRANKDIASFKLRKGMPIGCKVTLRGTRMYEFMERLIHVVLPRIRDFRGVSPKSFDGRGNYSMGIREQLVFMEIDHEKVKRTQGMDITFVTTAGSNDKARLLLERFGMPFSKTRMDTDKKT